MKKISLLLIAIFSVAFASAVIAADEAQNQNPLWTAEVIPVCQGVCLEGKQAIWQVQITNVGAVPFTLQKLGLVDSDGVMFAFTDLTGQEATIAPNQVGTVNIQGVVPPPTRGSTLYYKLNYVVSNTVLPDANFRAMFVMQLSDVECTSDEFCSDDNHDKICAGYKCVPYSWVAQNAANSSEVPKPKQGMDAEQVQIILSSAILAVLVILLLVFAFKGSKK